MIDSLRLSCPAEWFSYDVLEFLRSCQHRFTKSTFDGQCVLFSWSSAVALPSYMEGFFLQVGSVVTLEGSPKTYQGHNVTGPVDLLSAADRLVRHVFHTVFGLDDFPSPSRWFVQRFDVTHQFQFDNPEVLAYWMDTVKGVQRGIRRASVDTASPETALAFEGYGPASTLYVGKRSRYKASKIYCKGFDLMVHPPRAIRGTLGAAEALASEFKSVARFEAVFRALWVSDNAVKLGLLPSHFADLLPGVFRENAIKYILDNNISALVSRSSKEPRITFSVGYLSKFLDLDSLWRDEFAHVFSLECAMNDSTLLQKCIEVAPTPDRGRKAYQFLLTVRQVGLGHAREMVSQASWYRFRSILRAAGVSDVQMLDGAPLVRVSLDPVKVLEFRPNSQCLRDVETLHRAALVVDVLRLRRELKAA